MLPHQIPPNRVSGSVICNCSNPRTSGEHALNPEVALLSGWCLKHDTAGHAVFEHLYGGYYVIKVETFILFAVNV